MGKYILLISGSTRHYHRTLPKVVSNIVALAIFLSTIFILLALLTY